MDTHICICKRRQDHSSCYVMQAMHFFCSRRSQAASSLAALRASGKRAAVDRSAQQQLCEPHFVEVDAGNLEFFWGVLTRISVETDKAPRTSEWFWKPARASCADFAMLVHCATLPTHFAGCQERGEKRTLSCCTATSSYESASGHPDSGLSTG